MATITNLEFDHEGSTYSLNIDFDDSAIVEDTIAFDVSAAKTGGNSPAINLTARVEIHPPKDEVIIFIGDEEVFRFGVFEHDQSSAEQLIDRIPAEILLDPIIGCAVKAGVSAVVGQGIECCRNLEANLRWRIVTEYMGCMRENFGSISKTAVYRAFRCIFTGV